MNIYTSLETYECIKVKRAENERKKSLNFSSRWLSHQLSQYSQHYRMYGIRKKNYYFLGNGLNPMMALVLRLVAYDMII